MLGPAGRGSHEAQVYLGYANRRRRRLPDSRRGPRLAGQRAELQEKIKKLNAERETFVAAKRKEMAAERGEKTLDEAMLETIREQISKRGFESPNAEPAGTE